MSLLDTILSLQTDSSTGPVTVTRTLAGTHVDGVYTPGASSTLSIIAVIEPAFNLNRVVGGANLAAHVDGQQATDVRQLWTATKLFTRSPSTEPDVLHFEGADWTVARVEVWNLDGDIHYHCVCTKITGGGS